MKLGRHPTRELWDYRALVVFIIATSGRKLRDRWLATQTGGAGSSE
ncbi:MAG: hypothetical protein GY794_14590 [bacterium]|nr:hypothetical protein [bacterium]